MKFLQFFSSLIHYEQEQTYAMTIFLKNQLFINATSKNEYMC